jgi:predicted AAA+ superfamily ATPase
MIGKDLVQTVLIGGYPEMLRREDPKRRQTWARSYVRALVPRDVRDVADVEKSTKCRVCYRFLPTILASSPISRR